MITTPESLNLDLLCESLRKSESDTRWPGECLAECARAGFFRWFTPETFGGFGWTSSEIAQGYLKLSAADLTTTFILTQRVAALKRIVGCDNGSMKATLIPELLSGAKSATVGISHLTTSRQHVAKPVVSATRTDTGYRITGNCPWVTGAAEADFVLMGASVIDVDGTPEGTQILFLIEPDQPGVVVNPGFELLALSQSQTGSIRCDGAEIPIANVVAGPVENVLAGNGGGAGGLQTSVLALGLSSSAIEFIESESERRRELSPISNALQTEQDQIKEMLLAATAGTGAATAADIRSRANSLALRATQSAMVAAKGAGYVAGHPVGRWCREALFFLVWSCPQEVAESNLCEFSLLEPTAG
jgi:alkylation response protein AidB-like acyl-CoA dehydrogenase